MDEEQRVNIMVHDTIMELENCPSNYLWTGTGESRIRLVQKMAEAVDREEDFPMLKPSKILCAAGVNLKLEYTFYILAKWLKVLSSDQKLSCSDI